MTGPLWFLDGMAKAAGIPARADGEGVDAFGARIDAALEAQAAETRERFESGEESLAEYERNQKQCCYEVRQSAAAELAIQKRKVDIA